jgi:Tfp pilus assembly protein PilO
MPRNFNWRAAATIGTQHGPRRVLQLVCAALALLNGFALFIYFEVGSRNELAQESARVHREITATRARGVRLKNVAQKVQLSGTQASSFQTKYFLPKRTAYESVIGEIQRMATASGLQEKEAVYTEEPIEGTADLSLLNATATYEGPYDSLIRFLHEADRSPMLLMLDNMQAAPQQRGGQINTSIRFQAIVQESASPNSVTGGQQ